jgi:hypothetical protein
MTEFSVSAKEKQGLPVQGLLVQEKATIKSVYDEIAGEYDERIPGSAPLTRSLRKPSWSFFSARSPKASVSWIWDAAPGVSRCRLLRPALRSPAWIYPPEC